MCLTFPLSSSSVSMTIVNVLCSQIIRQKSSIVSSRGPVEKRKKVMKRGFFFSFLHLHCFSTEPFKRILHQSRDHTKIFNLPCVAIYAFSLRYPCKTITGIQIWNVFHWRRTSKPLVLGSSMIQIVTTLLPIFEHFHDACDIKNILVSLFVCLFVVFRFNKHYRVRLGTESRG